MPARTEVKPNMGMSNSHRTRARITRARARLTRARPICRLEAAKNQVMSGEGEAGRRQRTLLKAFKHAGPEGLTPSRRCCGAGGAADPLLSKRGSDGSTKVAAQVGDELNVCCARKYVDIGEFVNARVRAWASHYVNVRASVRVTSSFRRKDET